MKSQYIYLNWMKFNSDPGKQLSVSPGAGQGRSLDRVNKRV